MFRLFSPFFRTCWLPLLIVLTTLMAGCARHEYTGLVFDDPQPAAEIMGTDHDGSTFRLSDYRGNLSLLFFGYTYCPDICPMTLANVSQAYKEMEAESPDLVKDLTVVFVTIDPERDTPERLAEYVPLFNPNFHGVYIAQDQLDPVKSAYGVYAEKSQLPEGQTEAGYLVDHTAGVYLIDRQGNLRALFKHDIPSQDLVRDLKALLKLR
ncbi:MAG: SCO family protein [Caldilineaceae bacterium]|nr:SCO family protein [Caldilineaceae bacterium]